MFTNVIAGIDGFDGGRDAARLVKVLCDGRPTLVGAYPVEHDPSATELSRYAEIMRDDMVRSLEAAQRDADLDAELVAVPDRSPARALQQCALDNQAELIVIGSAHHGLLGRLVLGDVGRAVLHGSPCPVAVAPKRLRAPDTRAIAVGYDGSTEGQAALDLAARFAADRGSALTVITVWEDPPMPTAEGAYLLDLEQMRAERRREADETLSKALERLPSSTKGELLHGRPHDALASAGEGLDVLFVGSRCWGPVKRIAVGSTSDRLAHHAPCPVIVVPRPVPAAGEAQAEPQATTSAPS